MKNANVLSRSSLKNVMGGLMRDVCEGKTSVELEDCRYNVCMSRWNSKTHTPTENENKGDSCTAASSAT